MSSKEKLQRYSRKLLKKCLNLRAEEDLAIVAHESLLEISTVLWRIAKRACANTVSLTYRSRHTLSPAFPERIVSCLINSDACVVLAPALLNANIFDRARRNGTRIVNLHDTSIEQFTRAMANDLTRVSNMSRKLADLFSIGNMVTVSSDSGTELQIKISKLKGKAHTYLAQNAGEMASIPAGRACLSLTTRLSGKLVIDRVAGERRKLASPVILHIRNGQITQIKGEKEAESIRRTLRRFGKKGRQLNEFAVGANDKMAFGNSGHEDLNVAGSAHFTIGQDLVSPDQNKLLRAIKGIILAPTVTIDGRPVITVGKLVI